MLNETAWHIIGGLVVAGVFLLLALKDISNVK